MKQKLLIENKGLNVYVSPSIQESVYESDGLLCASPVHDDWGEVNAAGRFGFGETMDF